MNVRAILPRLVRRIRRAGPRWIDARFVDVAIVRGGMEQWIREGFGIARESNS